MEGSASKALEASIAGSSKGADADNGPSLFALSEASALMPAAVPDELKPLPRSRIALRAESFAWIACIFAARAPDALSPTSAKLILPGGGVGAAANVEFDAARGATAMHDGPSGANVG